MGEAARMVAWAAETRRVHQRLRDALEAAREAVEQGVAAQQVTRDLLLYCHGFCLALSGHHRGEDVVLFPEIERRHPELADTLSYLRRDHSQVEQLLGDLRRVLDRGADPPTLLTHLDGIAAIMESHFGYEERRLLRVLETLHLDADVAEVLGPLAGDG
jgi:iron-sulfur cluster repair protein YtfE (RIC family)